MRRHTDAADIFLFKGDVAVDPVFAEHAAAQQEFVVGLEGGKCFFQRSADGRDERVFFRRQVVQVFIGRVARMDFVLNAVQTRHQQGGKCQIRVGGRVGETRFDAARLAAVHRRDTDGSGTVFGGIGQFGRCFKVRHEAFVGVGGRIGNRVQGFGVFDDAADVVERGIGQTGIAVACEQVLTVFPNGLVDVHTAAVVAHNRFGHKGGGFAEIVGNVLDDVFHILGLVGAFDQSGETGADFHLAAGTDFAVVDFDFDAESFQNVHHGGAQILTAVNRRDGRVAAFDGGAVAGVLTVHMQAACPRAAFGRDFVTGFVHVGFKFYAVEDEEFGFGTEIGGVADTGRFQIGFGAACDGARVAVVTLTVGRVDDVAGNDDGNIIIKRIDEGCGRIGTQLHIGSLNAFPAADGRTVKRLTVFEPLFGAFQHDARRHGKVVLLAFGIGEAQIDKAGFAFFNQFYGVFNGHLQLLKKGNGKIRGTRRLDAKSARFYHADAV
uniref:Uncharacterized protein n=1 Tax=Neisseria gonorrhoeae TaxID=485 RepID=Q51065_NEIGO|nr:ORF1 [Neisseria gonorrhoeae]